MKPVIKCENISKMYRLGLTRRSIPSTISAGLKKIFHSNGGDSARRKFWALRDVTFDLERGESLALVGPNGAGKTTLLKLIASITRPTAGRMKINGRVSALIELGAGFHPDLTGRENIFLNGRILGLKQKDIAARLDRIIDFSGLEQFIDTPLKRYSSGMAVRLGFSVAAFVEPDILLVDEVLAVGDAQFRHKCMERIRFMLGQGTSMIFVSHNLWLVQAVCGRAIYFEHGVVQRTGKTDEVLEAYERSIHATRAAENREKNPESPARSEDVEITGIHICDEDGNAADEFRSDSAARLTIRYRVHCTLEEAILAVRIVRSDGLTCCLMRSNLAGFPIDLRDGSGTIMIELNPLQLYGGQYYAHAVLRDSDDSYGMASASSGFFYVRGSPLSHQEMNGVFIPNAEWKQIKNV